MRLVVLLLSGLGLLASLSAIGEARAASTLHVPADYPTIQGAINAAVDGDTVLVSPGTYHEHLDFLGKDAALQSSSGAVTTIIDGDHNGTVVTFQNGETRGAVLRGFTIRHGYSGIYTAFSSPTIDSNLIEDNGTDCGGTGVVVYFGGPLVERNTISGNGSVTCAGGGGSGGGGIAVSGEGAAEIVDNMIANNHVPAGDGGGLELLGTHGLRVIGNTIALNTAAGISPVSTGGGIDVDNGDPYIANNVIYGNVADAGGGIMLSLVTGAVGPNLVNNSVVGNHADQGSALFSFGDGAQTVIANNILVSDDATPALYCSIFLPTTAPILKNTILHSVGGPALGGICAGLGSSSDNFETDPLLMNPSGADFHLRAHSPAIDAGEASGLVPPDDFEGDPRPLDGDNDGIAAVDIGADEHNFAVDPDRDDVREGDACPDAAGPPSNNGCPDTSVGGDVILVAASTAGGPPVPLAAVVAAPVMLAVAGAFVWRRRRA